RDETGRAAGREAPEDRTPDEHGARAERERLQDVRPAPDAAIDQDLDPTRDLVEHLGQGVEAGLRPVELAPAMVRDDDGGDTVLDRKMRVLGGHDALEDERKRADRAQPLERVPGEPRLDLDLVRQVRRAAR